MGWMDKIKNKMQAATGAAEEKVGEKTGDRSLQAEGRADKATGNLKQAGEKVKDATKD